MKKIYSTIILALSFANIFAQAPNWVWANGAQGTQDDSGRGICTDVNGNVYVTGRFNSPTLTFGSYVITSTGGGNDIFIAKYDALGNVLWVKGALGQGESYDIAVDASGNVFISGIFYPPNIIFGADTLINTAWMTSDVFVAKYDSAGNELWAKSAGGSGDEYSSGICTDTSGNVFVTGSFYSSSITFGSATLNNPFFGSDMFIVKFDTVGNALWAKNTFGDGYEGGEGICIDATGDVFVLGNFGSTMSIFDGDTIINAGSSDFFVVKYSNSGNFLWVKSSGGIDFEYGSSITADEIGNIFITGKYSGMELPLNTDTLLNSSGGFEIFLIRYDNSGNEIWAKSIGGVDSDLSFGIDNDIDGNVFITGVFESATIAFATIVLTNSSMAGSDDIFVAKYDNSGNVIWAKNVGNSAEEASYALSSDISGNVFITGEFYSSAINFGSTVLMTSGGFSNYFVAKLDRCVIESFTQSPYICNGGVFNVGTQNYNASGTYQDTLTTISGCDSIVYTYLTVYPVFDETIDFFINSGDSIEVFGQVYTGAGTYIDTVNSAVGCDTIFTINIFIATSIKTIGNSTAIIDIFPNPFTTQTTIDLNSDYKNATIKIIDVLGKELKRINFSGKQIVLEREELNNGIYFIQIISEDKLIATNKIIIN